MVATFCPPPRLLPTIGGAPSGASVARNAEGLGAILEDEGAPLDALLGSCRVRQTPRWKQRRTPRAVSDLAEKANERCAALETADVVEDGDLRGGMHLTGSKHMTHHEGREQVMRSFNNIVSGIDTALSSRMQEAAQAEARGMHKEKSINDEVQRINANHHLNSSRTPKLRGLAARIATLQDKSAREHFESQLQATREQRAQQNHTNFLQRNAKSVRSCSPELSRASLEERARHRSQHQDEVRARWEDEEERSEQRKEEWLTRHDDRRRVRQCEELEKEVLALVEARQRDWLSRLALVAFTTQHIQAFFDAKSATDLLCRKRKAGEVLSSGLLRVMTLTRRKHLYQNVISLRQALIAFTRITRHAVDAAAQPPIRAWLETHSGFHKQAPTFSGLVQHFRVKVVRVQRRWRTVQRTREAYVKMMLPRWEEVAEGLFDELVTHLTQQADVMAKMKSHINREREDNGETALEKKDLLPLARQRLNENEKRFPRYLSRQLLLDYVKLMQRGHAKRLEDWTEKQVKFRFATDLEAFGVMDKSIEEGKELCLGKTRPRPVYIDAAEIADLARKNMDLWRSGGFKHVVNNACRLMKMVWHTWRWRDSGEVALRSGRRDSKETAASLVGMAARSANNFFDVVEDEA